MQEEKNNQPTAEQAGTVISPGGAVQPAQPTVAPPQPAAASQPEIKPPEEDVDSQNPEPVDSQELQDDIADTESDNDLEQPEDDVPAATHQPVSWLGSEYIHHEKTSKWFLALIAIAIVAAALAFLITRDFITSGMILFCAFIFGVFSRREPKQIQYSVSDDGITIDQKTFNYKQFKSFAVAQEGAIDNIILRPVQRFDTYKTIYCAPEQLDEIVEIMSSHMALDDHEPDVVDKLMLKVRF